MKEFVKKGVSWVFGALGAALAAYGLISSEAWAAFVTPDMVDAVTGVVVLVVGALVSKVTGWVIGMVGNKSVGSA